MSLSTPRHQCIDCKKEYPHGFTPRCKECQGLVEITHDLSRARFRDHRESLRRYLDYLPVQDPAFLVNTMSPEPTPCLHAIRLGRELGLEQVHIKIENGHPTGTTKDRMASSVLSMFNELGLREFVSSSTGNSSNSLAYGLERIPGMRMHLFLGADFGGRFRYTHDGIRLHVLEGLNFTETFNYAKQYAVENGLPFEAGFFNPARREGLKLSFFEAVEQIDRPIDWYFQASSSAMGVYGTAKGAGELVETGVIDRIPRMVCIQQDTCCPMVKAFEDDSPTIQPEHIFENPTGIAKAILRGDPSACYPYVYRMLKATNGLAISVTEQEILSAQQLLQKLEDQQCGYEGAATIAALKKAAANGDVSPNECVMLNLTS